MTSATIKQILAELKSEVGCLNTKICIIVDDVGNIQVQIDEINETLIDHETRITILESGFTQTIHVVTNYSALPDPTTVPGEFYFVENSQGTWWLPGSFGGTYYPGGVLYYSTGTVWSFTEVPFNAPQITVDAGINNDQFLTPLTFTNSQQLASKADIGFAIAMALSL